MARSMPEHPFLQGPWEPWPMEGDIFDLAVVQGEVPDDLQGALFRPGMNPQYPPCTSPGYSPVIGDGMVHQFRFDNGVVNYRNRWVRTPKFNLEREHRSAVFSYEGDFVDWRFTGYEAIKANPITDGVSPSVGNVTSWVHGDKVYALSESELPFEIDPITLDTVGTPDWISEMPVGPRPGQTIGGFCAHPKNCAATGEMVGFTMGIVQPYVTVHFFSPDGALKRSIPIEGPFAAWVHDFLVTEKQVIVPFFPVTLRPERIPQGRSMMGFEPDLGMHLAVIDRATEAITWFRQDWRYSFHPQAAVTVGNKIICDVPEFNYPPLPADGHEPGAWKDWPAAKMHRWTLDLDTGGFHTTQTDDRSIEFPWVDQRFSGLAHRYGYACGASDGGEIVGGFDSLVRYDLDAGTSMLHTFPAGQVVQEPIFVPRLPDAPEGVGYLLQCVTEVATSRSSLVILDAERLGDEPVATLALPHRVPASLHGSWMGGRPAG